MQKIYRESFRYFLTSLPVLLLFAAIIEVMHWLLQPTHESLTSFGALILAAYFFHRHFLFGEALNFQNRRPSEGAPDFKFGWFFVVSVLLILGTMVIGIGVVLGLDIRNDAAVLLTILVTYFLTLSLFGTALPAAVARDNTYRLAQGLRATSSTMWHLLLGPGLIGFLLIAAMLACAYTLASLRIGEDSLITLGFYIAVRTMGFLTTIFAVAVLCEMYRRTRPEPRDPQGSGAVGQRPA